MIGLETTIEEWAMVEPFATARDSVAELPVLYVRLVDHLGRSGHGEAAGVDYDGETPATMQAELHNVRHRLHDDLTPVELLQLLPAGGARNALDCALWDLRAKQSGRPAWQLLGLPAPVPVTTAFTIGLGDVADVRRKARAVPGLPLLKLKVDAERHVDLVRVVREIHPHAGLLLDANQSWNRDLLERLLPALAALDVALVEQPLPRGAESALDGVRSPIPLAADESCTDRTSLDALAGLVQYVNVKLDKTGGLTEALAVCAAARRRGLGVMVGNMCGTSLAMAPAFLVAQSCDYVDLDGPLLQKSDRPHPIRYEAGRMGPPDPRLWG